MNQTARVFYSTKMLKSKRAKSEYCHTMLCESVFYLVFCSCRGEMIKRFFFSHFVTWPVYLLALPHTICFHNAPTFIASCFHTPFSCTYSQVFGGIKYCSSLECTIDGWIYFLYEKQKWDKKTKRLSSCSDHLVQYCTKKWKGQKLLSKEKCRSWALALVTLRSFTKRDRKKTYSSRTSMVIYCETVILLN